MFLFVACPIALRQQTPGRSQLLPTATGFGFACATAVRVINRIAGDTAVDRPDAAMAGTSCLAENDVFVLRISDLANSRVAILVDAPDFTGRKANLGIAFVAGHKSRSATCRSDHLSATSGCQFEIMNRETDRNGAKRKTVAHFRRSSWAAHEFRANLETG